MKLAEKEKAIALREKGYSVKEISRELCVAKSSVSLWVRNVVLSEQAKMIIQGKSTAGQLKAQEARRNHTKKSLGIAKQKAMEVLSGIPDSKSLRQLSCALLYWCEGRKAPDDRDFKFTNSDPQLVSAFMQMFRSSFDGIDERKFRACVHLHSYHNPEEILRFWSKITNIPLGLFMKPYQKKNTGKQIHEGYKGCITINYYDTEVAREICGIARAFLAKYGPIG